MLGLHHRLAGLRATLAGREVLLAGRLADSPAMLKLLRFAGARFMAARDLQTALHLIGRFGIEIVVVDGCREDADELALFELAAEACRHSGQGPSFVRLNLPDRRFFGSARR